MAFRILNILNLYTVYKYILISIHGLYINNQVLVVNKCICKYILVTVFNTTNLYSVDSGPCILHYNTLCRILGHSK